MAEQERAIGLAPTVAVRSTRLAAELERAGCRQLGRNVDGYVFARTDTVRRLIAEYVDRVDLARARQSFKNEPRISRR
jgi:hypothetical protein